MKDKPNNIIQEKVKKLGYERMVSMISVLVSFIGVVLTSSNLFEGVIFNKAKESMQGTTFISFSLSIIAGVLIAWLTKRSLRTKEKINEEVLREKINKLEMLARSEKTTKSYKKEHDKKLNYQH